MVPGRGDSVPREAPSGCPELCCARSLAQESCELFDELVGGVKEAGVVVGRRDERGVVESSGRERNAAAVHGLDHADAEELVARGAGDDVALPQQAGVVVCVRGVADVEEPVGGKVA